MEKEEALAKRIQTPKKSIKLRPLDEKSEPKKPRVSDYHSPRISDVSLKLEEYNRSRKHLGHYKTADLSQKVRNEEQMIPKVSIFLDSETAPPCSPIRKMEILEEDIRIDSLKKEFEVKLKLAAELQEQIKIESLISNELRKKLIDLSINLL